VLHGVGQRLLDDPVDDQLDAGRQRSAGPVDLQGHIEAGVAALPHQVGQLLDVGLGQPGRGAVRLPQDAHQPPHLTQRAPAGGLDVPDGLDRPLGIPSDRAPGRAGLDHHHAHAVGHDVVQLAGDPAPLLQHRLLGQRVLLALEVGRPVLDGGDVGPAHPHVVAQQPGQGERAHRAQRVLDLRVGAVEHQAHREHQHRPGEAGQRRPPADVRAEAVDGDQGREPRPRSLVLQLEVQQGQGEDEAEDRQRMAPPPEQGHGRDHDEQRADGVRILHGGILGLGEQGQEPEQDGDRRDQPVEDQGVVATPGVGMTEPSHAG
jgi:hypothetical protein